MAVIRWTDEAASWLEDIHKYISKESPRDATKVVRAIYAKIQIIAEYPEIGYLHRRSTDGDIRVLLYGHYRIAYLVRARDVLEVLGIFHGALDILRYL